MAKTENGRRPRKLLVVAVASLSLNIILLGALAVGYILQQNGYFDYAIINNGVNKLCSEEFQERTASALKDSDETTQKKVAATLTYQCGNGEASEYYDNGLKEFLKSKGVEE